MVTDLIIKPKRPHAGKCVARPAGQKAGEHHSPPKFRYPSRCSSPPSTISAVSPKLNEAGHADRSKPQNAKRQQAEGAAPRAHRAARSVELPLHSDGLQCEC